VILNSGAVVEHDCVVGDGAHVSPNATLTGNVRVGARSWVGAGAVVLPGVRVGDDARVGAGAVVTRAVTDGATVMGVPARPGVPLDR
jgi:acetyltransferase-like isoleucine patch superfamily enzyme